jgi:hypothetical protein
MSHNPPESEMGDGQRWALSKRKIAARNPWSRVREGTVKFDLSHFYGGYVMSYVMYISMLLLKQPLAI